MSSRYSRVSYVVLGLPLAAALAGACATSAGNNLHGPAFGGDSGADASDSEGSAGDDAMASEGGSDASLPTADGSPGVDAAREAGADAAPGSEGGLDGGSDGPAEAALEAGGKDAGFVAPVCDGVIGTNEYGGAAYQLATSTGQTWYVTWDSTHLYLAVSGAAVAEANVVYLGLLPVDAGAGLTTGYSYDGTDARTLPFGASVVVYAKQGYQEARTAAGTWGSPNTTAVQFCSTGSSSTIREEVIPWSLLGGEPSGYAWLGYLAANPASNPTGYIYGQVPTDDPGGADAGGESFTKYYAIPSTSPGANTPFADEQ